MESILRRGRSWLHEAQAFIMGLSVFLYSASASKAHSTSAYHEHQVSATAWDWAGMGRGSLAPIGIVLLFVLAILAYRRWGLRRPKFRRLTNIGVPSKDETAELDREATEGTIRRADKAAARELS